MLSDGDNAIIREVAQKMGQEILVEVRRETQIQLKLHAAECPVAKEVEAVKNKASGGWAVLAAIGAAIAALAALVMQWVKG